MDAKREQALLRQIETMQALATELLNLSYSAKKQLAPVSSGAGARKGTALTPQQKANLISTRRKGIMKNAKPQLVTGK